MCYFVSAVALMVFLFNFSSMATTTTTTAKKKTRIIILKTATICRTDLSSTYFNGWPWGIEHRNDFQTVPKCIAQLVVSDSLLRWITYAITTTNTCEHQLTNVREETKIELHLFFVAFEYCKQIKVIFSYSLEFLCKIFPEKEKKKTEMVCGAHN